MKNLTSLTTIGGRLALASALTLGGPIAGAMAQTAEFVSANSTSITGEVSALSHVIMVQIPRPVVLDIGAREQTTLTVPTLSDIVINGQKVAPAQTPVLISVEPTADKKSAVVRAKAIMLQGKLIALDATGDAIPSFVVNKKDFNDRVKTAMNLGAVVGNGLAGTMGANVLGTLGASMGDPTGTNLANQITSAGGLLGIMGGMFGGGGGKRIVDLQANSIHVLTVKNPAMIVAQMIQLNREIAAGNSQIMGEIAGQIKTSDSAAVVTTVKAQTPQSISQTVKTTAGVF
ncbi:MAG: hypothetical protein ACO24E_07635 [Vulcanococcus sp.]|jgi:hypothetical protein